MKNTTAENNRIIERIIRQDKELPSCLSLIALLSEEQRPPYQ